MTTHKTSKFFFLAFLIIFTAIGWYAYDQNQKEKTRIAHEKYLKIQEEKAEQGRIESIEKAVREHMDALKTVLKEKTNHYKKQKKVLKQIIQAENYETPEYAKSTYEFFTRDIAPNLRKESAEIINSFVEADDSLSKVLNDIEGGLEHESYATWQKYHKEQLENYINYFTKEEEKLQKYTDLVTFYYRYSKRYTVDMVENNFIFSNAQDEITHIELLNALKTEP